MIYWELLWSFIQIGLFSIGGGYASMPLIQAQVVDKYHWLTLTEFADIITISQMTPGPVAINSATFVGMRIGGIGGALVATLGCILPSCAIVLTLSWIYFKYRSVSVVQGVLAGLRPTIVALIASAGVTILLMSFFNGATESLSHLPFSQLDWVAIVLFALCLILLRKTKVSPLLIMAGAGVVGMVTYPLLNR